MQDIKQIQNALKKGNFCPSCGLFCCFLHSREEIETRMQPNISGEPINTKYYITIPNEAFHTTLELEGLRKRNKAWDRLKN
jgi:hypothetical protein